ncbi:hypothetical protein TRVA0_055S00694 [Trichomonascus vanleenenianus]|uniref:uncharacterized protein n=1 Tax=Trichomonascus vanleenenianus TaxID=2268995 RepID=UPI003ECA7287
MMNTLADKSHGSSDHQTPQRKRPGDHQAPLSPPSSASALLSLKKKLCQLNYQTPVPASRSIGGPRTPRVTNLPPPPLPLSSSHLVTRGRPLLPKPPDASSEPRTPARTPLTPADSANAKFAFISHSPVTYPTRQPAIDDMQLVRRKRRRTSPTELSILESEFSQCIKPSKEDRERIARLVGMTEKAVQIWFQNKRQAYRKQQQRGGSMSTPRPKKGDIIAMTPVNQKMVSSGVLSAGRRQLSTPVYSTPRTANSNSNNGHLATPVRASSFHIYSDNKPKLCLSMSDDGKAEVIDMQPKLESQEAKKKENTEDDEDEEEEVEEGLRSPPRKTVPLTTPLTPMKKSRLNAMRRGLTKRTNNECNDKNDDNENDRTNTTPELKSPSAKEKECITNLLSLRGGKWN